MLLSKAKAGQGKLLANSQRELCTQAFSRADLVDLQSSVTVRFLVAVMLKHVTDQPTPLLPNPSQQKLQRDLDLQSALANDATQVPLVTASQLLVMDLTHT